METPAQDAQSQAQVGIGCRVEVELIDAEGNVEPMQFNLVRDEAADLDRGYLGEGTPLAKAIRGKRVGALIAYGMGDIQQVKIVRVQAGLPLPTSDGAARRRAILDEARRKAERTSAEMFAASYDGKWGDYELAEDLSEERGETDDNTG
ncbi:MAG: hypothetical protein HC802_15325 [Caldilineaceae bacterium]|nr:hypothetical protein [Caldilineaceae bacterium]